MCYVTLFHWSIIYEIPVFKCSRCGVQLAEAGLWRQHEAASHQHACTQEDCSLAFTTLPQLNSHLNTVHNIYRKQVWCTVLRGRFFSSFASLEQPCFAYSRSIWDDACFDNFTIYVVYFNAILFNIYNFELADCGLDRVGGNGDHHCGEEQGEQGDCRVGRDLDQVSHVQGFKAEAVTLARLQLQL